MALAAATHHSAQRGEWRDLNEAPRGQRTASAEATYDALRSQMTSVGGGYRVLLAVRGRTRGARGLTGFNEVRPQHRVQRRNRGTDCRQRCAHRAVA